MTAKARRAELRDLMSKRDMRAPQVADIVERSPQTVRAWMYGTRNVPTHALKLLKLELARR